MRQEAGGGRLAIMYVRATGECHMGGGISLPTSTDQPTEFVYMIPGTGGGTAAVAATTTTKTTATTTAATTAQLFRCLVL